MTSWQPRELADARGRHLPLDLSLPLLPAVSAGSGEGGRESTVCCWSHQSTTSRAQEGRTTTGSTWTGDGKRRQAGPIVGWRRLSTSTPGRSGAVSHRVGHHICPHPVTREPSSLWTASTSWHWAFQSEVARSDLGGRRPKGRNPLGSRREGKRGAPDPLLPPKANLRSQSSGYKPATACLEGRSSQDRRPLPMNWLWESVHTCSL